MWGKNKQLCPQLLPTLHFHSSYLGKEVNTQITRNDDDDDDDNNYNNNTYFSHRIVDAYFVYIFSVPPVSVPEASALYTSLWCFLQPYNHPALS
jgi:hypothetical protein